MGSESGTRRGVALPNRKRDKSPSDLQLANLYNGLKEANPDLAGTKCANAYKKKDFEFWRDNQAMLERCAAALKKRN